MKTLIAVGLAFCLQATAAVGQTPSQAWKAAIAEQDKSYSKVPHAMLKIQDAVYLREGETAALTGRRDRPDSWRWTKTPSNLGVLQIALKDKKLSVLRLGKPAAPDLVRKGLGLDKGVDITGQPTQVAAGVMGWRIFLFNQNNPAAKAFTGVSYFPYDDDFRVKARFAADPALPPRVFRTSRGTDKQFFHAGDASFTLKGKTITLPLYAESNKPGEISDLSAFFTDKLTGQGTYGAGRYVDVNQFGRFPPANVTIDFNFTYNPNCARSPHFTCPVAVDTVPVAVAAGERDPHAAH